MSQIANEHDATSATLQRIYAPVEVELAEAEQIFRAEMRNDHPYVNQLVQYGCLLGGKRLRPALLLLAGQASGRIAREHLVLAAVVEMIHTATLVHDDVIDEADMRRHLATVNARWDNEASVLLGDYLFTHAFYLAATLENAWACRVIGQATNTVCEGEIRQKGSRAQFLLSEAEYLSIIEAKTAELCACSCRLGAHYAAAPETVVERLANFGRHLGVAFQITDDVLDVLGDERAVGKSLGTDFCKQKPTLPLIRVLQRADSSLRQELLAMLQETNGKAACGLEVLLPLFDRFQAIRYAREKAIHFARLAAQELAPLKPGAAKDALLELTRFVVDRAH